MKIKSSTRFPKRELPTHHVEKMGKSLQQLREDFFAAHPDQFQGGRYVYFFAGEAEKQGMIFRNARKWSCLMTAESPIQAWQDCIDYIEAGNPGRVVSIHTMTEMQGDVIINSFINSLQK